jgi:hypothetical protein
MVDSALNLPGRLPTKTRPFDVRNATYCYAPDVYRPFIRIVGITKIDEVVRFEAEWSMSLVPMQYLGKSSLPRAKQLVLKRYPPSVWQACLKSWEELQPTRQELSRYPIRYMEQAFSRDETIEFAIRWPNSYMGIEELKPACLPMARDLVVRQYGTTTWEACLERRRNMQTKYRQPLRPLPC